MGLSSESCLGGGIRGSTRLSRALVAEANAVIETIRPEDAVKPAGTGLLDK
jgi:hypothetical protein